MWVPLDKEEIDFVIWTLQHEQVRNIILETKNTKPTERIVAELDLIIGKFEIAHEE